MAFTVTRSKPVGDLSDVCVGSGVHPSSTVPEMCKMYTNTLLTHTKMVYFNLSPTQRHLLNNRIELIERYFVIHHNTSWKWGGF